MASQSLDQSLGSMICNYSRDDNLLQQEDQNGVAGTFETGNLHIEVVIGDILVEGTDAIVNSIGPNLNFDAAGYVAKAIKRSAGQSVLDECNAIEKPIAGLAVTGAGDLKCKHIFHVASRPSEWNTWVEKTLIKAEELSLGSISFPALGTGNQKLSSEKMATVIVSALAKFVADHEYSHVELIKIVLYKRDMVTDFLAALEKMRDCVQAS